eukprot:133852-Prorocentrum_minimum.AAC.3
MAVWSPRSQHYALWSGHHQDALEAPQVAPLGEGDAQVVVVPPAMPPLEERRLSAARCHFEAGGGASGT